MPEGRSFKLGDLMALVAATAIGLTLDRWRAAEFGPLPSGTSTNGVAASTWLAVLAYGRPSCYVVALALVLIPLRWIRPRPPAKKVIRQPGAVACLAIVGTVAVKAAMIGLAAAFDRRGALPGSILFTNWYYWHQAVSSIPMVVLGAWTALALGARWSPEKSWIDRAGILMGLYWLASYFLNFFSAIIDAWLPYES